MQEIKTWQDRLREKFPETADRNLFTVGHLEHAMEAEIADLRAALTAPQAADTDKVREAIPDGWQLVPTTPTTEMFRVGCEVHDQRPSEVREVYSAMLAAAPLPAAPVREVPGWIACDDRLPDMHTEVMVWPHPSDECMTAEVRGDGTWYYSEYTAHHGWDSVMLAVGRVTHWMPLPAAPVQQEGE